MSGIRQNLRLGCYSPCFLKYMNINYPAQLVNISLGGALVSVEGDVLYKLHIGDMCDLMLGDDPEQCVVKYSCKIISQNDSTISINFQGIHLMS